MIIRCPTAESDRNGLKMLFIKTEVSRTALLIVSFCPHLFQDNIDVFLGFRFAQLVHKIAEALVDGNADPSSVWEMQIPERLEHIILINGFYFHIWHLQLDERKLIYEHDQYLELPMIYIDGIMRAFHEGRLLAKPLAAG